MLLSFRNSDQLLAVHGTAHFCIFLRIICGSHLLLEAKGLASLSMQRGNTRNSSPIPRMLAFGGIIINEKKPTQRSLGRQQYVGITKENL